MCGNLLSCQSNLIRINTEPLGGDAKSLLLLIFCQNNEVVNDTIFFFKGKKSRR